MDLGEGCRGSCVKTVTREDLLQLMLLGRTSLTGWGVGGGDNVEGGSNTSEGLLQLVPVGSAFQEASQGDDDVFKAGPLAGVFMPAVLHELEVVLNSGQGLTREGLQRGQLWPLMLLSQHQHDLHRHCHCYSMVWQKNIAVPPKLFMCSDLELDRQNCFMLKQIDRARVQIAIEKRTCFRTAIGSKQPPELTTDTHFPKQLRQADASQRHEMYGGSEGAKREGGGGGGGKGEQSTWKGFRSSQGRRHVIISHKMIPKE